MKLCMCFIDWLVMKLTVHVFHRLASDEADCVCVSRLTSDEADSVCVSQAGLLQHLHGDRVGHQEPCPQAEAGPESHGYCAVWGTP